MKMVYLQKRKMNISITVIRKRNVKMEGKYQKVFLQK